MKISKLIFILLILSTQTNRFEAQNLAPNPSFEDYVNTFCGVQFASDFNEIMTDWINPTQASPQVFFTNVAEECYNFQPESTYSGPLGLKGNQEPRTGDVMLGLWSYTFENFNQRHYAQVPLISPMIVGDSYVVEFYASLGDNMEFGIDKLGAYLSTDQPTATNDGILNFVPQMESDGFITDVSDWVLISDTIIAQEAYSYLTIGNFNNDASTNTITNPTSTEEPGTYGAFYFVDDVRVERISTVGVADFESTVLKIFPTKVTNNANLQLPSDSWVSVRNSFGQMVFTRFMKSGANQVDVSGFSNGVYYISVLDETGVTTRRVVK